jgi:hypothetical protein
MEGRAVRHNFERGPHTDHLEWRAGLSDTILKGDHTRTTLNGGQGCQTQFWKRTTHGPPWMEGRAVRHNIERGPHMDHLEWRAGLSDTILKEDHTQTTLNGGRGCQTQFWKRTTHGPPQSNLFNLWPENKKK